MSLKRFQFSDLGVLGAVALMAVLFAIAHVTAGAIFFGLLTAIAVAVILFSPGRDPAPAPADPREAAAKTADAVLAAETKTPRGGAGV